MFNAAQLEGLTRKVLEIIPDEMGQAPEAFKAQLKAGLQRALQDMDLVTREEFDVQTAVLAKTRAKLEAIEQRLADWDKPGKDV
ncbi:accessory factor UbiK family protein [Thiomicrospira microaerophila]|uniref:accessory factor UbiK family protein n=1 Tax=Thiomicrospira microaerophila TaxID=406020 RepID=UPI00200C7284|nr:accessory factor UbiK family protein [Thiomicrospira microaerophila]UQB42040.1 accessory factor UbiK family protein [Thiomicrospira microaerophila]